MRRELSATDLLALHGHVADLHRAKTGEEERTALVALRAHVDATLATYPADPGSVAEPAPRRRGPTPRQLQVLQVIVRHSARGVPPTYREIGDALGIGSPNGVMEHVNALVTQGLLERRAAGQARTLRPTRAGRALVRATATAASSSAGETDAFPPGSWS